MNTYLWIWNKTKGRRFRCEVLGRTHEHAFNEKDELEIEEVDEVED